MARKIRIEYAGAIYHVMARGNQGRDIDRDDRDRKLWLETLAGACEKTGWRLHAWVLMGNLGLEKQVLAWWLCQHTTVRRRWVSKRLDRGDESRVTHAIRGVKQEAQSGVRTLKRKLEQSIEANR